MALRQAAQPDSIVVQVTNELADGDQHPGCAAALMREFSC
jgi:hypothetical protein